MRQATLEAQLSAQNAELDAHRAECARLRQRMKKRGSAPQQFDCPIDMDVMHDPVFAADGHTYERSAIQRWLAVHDISPLTNEPLVHKELTPNFLIRSMIREYMEEMRKAELET